MKAARPDVVWWGDGNMMADRGGTVRAFYALGSYNYDHLSDELQMEHFVRLQRVVTALENAEEVTLRLVRRHANPEEILPQPNPADPSLLPVAEHYRERMVEELTERLTEPTTMEWYLDVALRKAGFVYQSPVHAVKWLLRDIQRQAMESKLRVPVLTDDARASYAVAEDQIHQLLRRHIRADRVDVPILEWLVSRAYWRGLPGEPPVRRGWSPRLQPELSKDGEAVNYIPDVRELKGLAAGTIRHRYNHTEIQQLVDGEWLSGYHRVYALSAVPNDLSSGVAWAYHMAQSLPFGVEVIIRWRPMDHKRTLEAINKRTAEIKHQADEAQQAGQLDDDLEMAAGDAADYQAKLKAERAPSLLANVLFVVSAEDLRILDQRSSQLVDTMREMSLPLERPQGDMERAFFSTVPGAPMDLRDYELRVTPEFVASSGAGATGQVGDPHGGFVGWTHADEPVYEDPTWAARINEALSGASTGRLGGGKTFIWRLKILIALLFYKSKGLYLDPKGETDDWLRKLPWLAHVTHKIALTPNSNCEGALDLLALARSGGSRDKAAELALSVLAGMFGLSSNDEQTDDLAEAIQEALRLPIPSMEGVIEALEAKGADNLESTAARMARRLRNWKKIGLGRCLFGTPETEPISVTSPLTVLQLHHVPLPPEDRPRADYSPQEIVNSAIMQAAIGWATAFILQDRSQFAFVFVDEAWSILSNREGAHVVKFLIRTGRATKKAVWIASQLAGDLREERANLGVRYLFRGRDVQEIAQQLEFAGLPATEDNIETIKSLSNGEALMVDTRGRAARVRIDAVFGELIDAFDTRPPAA